MTDVIERTSDPMQRLSAYRPTDATIDAEWSPTARAETLAAIAGRASTTGDADLTRAGSTEPLRFIARPAGHRRRPLAVPVAACIVVALVGVVLVYVVRTTSGGDGRQPPASGYTAPSVVATPRVASGQYSLRADVAYTVRADGSRTSTPEQTNEDWVSPDGSIWSYRATSGAASSDCYRFGFTGTASFGNPDQAFFDSLPTDPDELTDYLRSNVSGSTSRDEAVFVAVGDALRTADGLASAPLRAALVSVLSRTAGVSIHNGVTDDRDRAAVRADFVDERNRPGEIVSLYFAADTYQLIEERDGSTSAATTEPAAAGSPAGGAGSPSSGFGGSPAGGFGSPAYTRNPDDGATPAQLSGPANIDVMTSETIVDSLPAKVTALSCQD